MKKLLCSFLFLFVLLSFVFPVFAAGFVFLPDYDRNLVYDSILVPGSYEVSFVFDYGISGVGLAPFYVSFAPYENLPGYFLSPELSIDVEFFDSTGHSLGVQSGTFYLAYDESFGRSFLIFEGESSHHLASVTLVPVSSVPDVSASDLMADVASLFSGNFNVQTLLIVIAAALGVSVGIVLLWFNFHYIKFKLSGALRKGRL